MKAFIEKYQYKTLKEIEENKLFHFITIYEVDITLLYFNLTHIHYTYFSTIKM